MKATLPILLVFLASNLLAAYEPIAGLVLDAKTRQPLPFANIVVEGQHRGTVSNGEGYFILDTEGISPNTIVLFSYVGYEVLKITAGELQNLKSVYLNQAAINLQAVEVRARSLTAEKIIELVRENYRTNYPTGTGRQRIFYHKYETTPFPQENRINLKKSDFVGLDRATFDELFEKLPREFIEYRDAMVDMYADGDNMKLIPIEGISLEESGMQNLGKEMEKKLGSFFDDIQKSGSNADVYYKFRTGIFSIKAGKGANSDSLWSRQKEDTLNYLVKTEVVKNEIAGLEANYSSIKSKNWEFITHTGRYTYAEPVITVLNDESVYEISFAPKKKGLFEGKAYISTATYAVVQLDFAFAPDKTSEDFHMLGFGHSMNFKKGRVMYEKRDAGYFLKYIYAQQHESGSIERKFTISKRQKRFLADKELNEIKLEAELYFDTETVWELLVLDRQEIVPSQFEKVVQPPIIKFRKKYVYAPEIWNDRTVIAPTAELKKYKRH